MEAQHSLQITALPSRGQIRRALPVPHLGHFVFTGEEVEVGSANRQLLRLGDWIFGRLQQKGQDSDRR